MDSPVTRRFAARHDQFDAIRAFIEASCATLNDVERQRVVLLVEELFANSLNHGYGGDSDQPVWLTLDIGDDGCRLVYEDCGPPHDPFAAVDHDLDRATPEERRVGGLGIILLVELSSTRSYERRVDRNVIELHVRRSRHH